jgi:asparagine synthase (glutamine-hydrolysing)
MCCRIAGTVNYPNEVIISMLDKQKKGGPDLSKFYKINYNTNFGHNLLSIIGHQEQPVTLNRYTLVFNGVWYDYRDFYPDYNSDTLALVQHFEKKGLKAIDDVNGMFGIGLFDSYEQKIHLFVDRFGQKPVYYYHEGNKFAFASNPAALYDLKDKWELDREALQSYWLLGSVMGSDGIFKGIKKLTASEHLTYDLRANKIDIERYYEPKFQDKTDGIEDLVLDSIRKVKVSDVPVHIFLSGGIDSTLVASQFEGGNAIHLDGPEYEYAKKVSDKFNINLKRLFPEDIKIEECLTDYCLNSGEPSMAALIPYVTAKETSKFGRVAITANGADELFFGYDRTHEKETDLRHIFRWSCADQVTQLQNITFNHVCKYGAGRWKELETYIQYDLNKTLDSASMCHGLEVRSPFLDHRLVEMALSIPESKHRLNGNKTILKGMLRKMGFENSFLDRPKLGFSLFKKPTDMNEQLDMAWSWVKSNGFLTCDDGKLSGRDYQYLRMSALGFYYWFKVWKNKIL